MPEDYGGYGVRVMNLCIIREELARVSAQADTNFIMQGLGSFPITLGGNHEQKARYLPPVGPGRVHRRLRSHRAPCRLRRTSA